MIVNKLNLLFMLVVLYHLPGADWVGESEPVVVSGSSSGALMVLLELPQPLSKIMN